jgi:hypothetical protein
MIGRVLAAAVAMTALATGTAAADTRCGATLHQRYGETRAYFRDVLGACRPDGYCSAVVALSDKDGAAYLHQLRVARPLAGEPWQVEFVAVSPTPAEPATPMTLGFGRDTVVLNDAIANVPNVMNEYRVSSQAVADDLVARLKRGRTATWTYRSVAGPSSATFPLRGMTAALTWIDCMTTQPAR